MLLIRTELWERLIFNDEDVSNPFVEEEEGTIFRSPHGMFVTMNIDLNVRNEKEVKRAYNEKNTDAFEILKQGMPPEEHIWIGKCDVCLSEVKAKYSVLHNIDWSSEGEGYATCPFCQQINMKFIRRPIDEKENEFERMTEHTFIFKNGEYSKENCEYCRELETDNWHYYKCEDGSMLHVRKDAIAAIKGGTYDDIIKNK